jgi:N-acetylglucosamine kinase-like BadF-type ATPase
MCTTADDLTTAIYAPTITNERLAGFGRDVVDAAKAKDEVAMQIVADGGTELGHAAVAVIRHCRWSASVSDRVRGGVFPCGGRLDARHAARRSQKGRAARVF